MITPSLVIQNGTFKTTRAGQDDAAARSRRTPRRSADWTALASDRRPSSVPSRRCSAQMPAGHRIASWLIADHRLPDSWPALVSLRTQHTLQQPRLLFELNRELNRGLQQRQRRNPAWHHWARQRLSVPARFTARPCAGSHGWVARSPRKGRWLSGPECPRAAHADPARRGHSIRRQCQVSGQQTSVSNTLRVGLVCTPSLPCRQTELPGLRQTTSSRSHRRRHE